MRTPSWSPDDLSAAAAALLASHGVLALPALPTHPPAKSLILQGVEGSALATLRTDCAKRWTQNAGLCWTDSPAPICIRRLARLLYRRRDAKIVPQGTDFIYRGVDALHLGVAKHEDASTSAVSHTSETDDSTPDEMETRPPVLRGRLKGFTTVATLLRSGAPSKVYQEPASDGGRGWLN
jgi:hypothetical protein